MTSEASKGVLEYIGDSRTIIANGQGILNKLNTKTKDWARIQQQEPTNIDQLQTVTYDAIAFLSQTLKEIHKELDALTHLQENNAVQVSGETALLSEQFKVMNSTLGLDQYIKGISAPIVETEFRVDKEVPTDNVPVEFSYEFNTIRTVGIQMDKSVFDFAKSGNTAANINNMKPIDKTATVKAQDKKFDSNSIKKSRDNLGDSGPVYAPPPVQIQKQAPAPPPPTAEVPAVHIKKAKVLYNYAATDADELNIKAGDFIDVLNEDMGEGWALGVSQGKKGLFPRSYVAMQ